MAGSLGGFTIGIGGLHTASRAIEVVSQNIANSNVVGFKGAEFLFVDQYFRALSSTEVGRAAQGVSETAARRQFSQGSLRTTNSPLDLAINGQGFFRLCSKTGTDAGLIYYTRNGQLSVDKDGYIVNATGLYLTGYNPNVRGDAVTNDIAPMKLPPAQRAPQPTSEAQLAVNLDARGDIKKNAGQIYPKPFDPNDDSTFASATSFTTYDASGSKNTVKVYYRRVDDTDATFTDEDGNTTTRVSQEYKLYMSVTDVDGNTSWVKDVSGTGAGTFETVSTAPEGAGPDATHANPDWDTDDYSIKSLYFFEGQNTESIYRDSKTGEAINRTTLDFSVVVGDDADTRAIQSIQLDLTDTTRFSADFEVKNLTQDGFPVGALNSVAFDESGFLVGIYSNGQRLIAGQAVLTKFNSPEGLSPIAQNLFAQTVASGEPLIGVPGSGSFGVVRNSALEEANIDMASELVALMIQQRNYQANSESIRAQDELLKSTISLTR